jgi:hypothetical protein
MEKMHIFKVITFVYLKNILNEKTRLPTYNGAHGESQLLSGSETRKYMKSHGFGSRHGQTLRTIFYNIVFHEHHVGGSIFIHVFGAYFGLFMSLIDCHQQYSHPEISNRQISNIRSDLFSLLGTLVNT